MSANPVDEYLKPLSQSPGGVFERNSKHVIDKQSYEKRIMKYLTFKNRRFSASEKKNGEWVPIEGLNNVTFRELLMRVNEEANRNKSLCGPYSGFKLVPILLPHCIKSKNTPASQPQPEESSSSSSSPEVFTPNQFEPRDENLNDFVDKQLNSSPQKDKQSELSEEEMNKMNLMFFAESIVGGKIFFEEEHKSLINEYSMAVYKKLREKFKFDFENDPDVPISKEEFSSFVQIFKLPEEQIKEIRNKVQLDLQERALFKTYFIMRKKMNDPDAVDDAIYFLRNELDLTYVVKYRSLIKKLVKSFEEMRAAPPVPIIPPPPSVMGIRRKNVTKKQYKNTRSSAKGTRSGKKY